MRKISLEVSVGLNVLLGVAVVGLGVLLLWREWRLGGEIDARPKGVVIKLAKDMRIVGAGVPAIQLPAGTILQESTPQGAATLGKISHREYMLTIKTEDFEFSKNSPTERVREWVEPYTFAASP